MQAATASMMHHDSPGHGGSHVGIHGGGVGGHSVGGRAGHSSEHHHYSGGGDFHHVPSHDNHSHHSHHHYPEVATPRNAPGHSSGRNHEAGTTEEGAEPSQSSPAGRTAVAAAGFTEVEIEDLRRAFNAFDECVCFSCCLGLFFCSGWRARSSYSPPTGRLLLYDLVTSVAQGARWSLRSRGRS